MTPRSLALVLAVLGTVAVGCAAPGVTSGTSTTGSTTDDPPTTRGPLLPSPTTPPGDVLDATLVYFDGDGRDAHLSDPPFGRIVEQSALDAFAARYVDGDPGLATAAADALSAGQVLVGGVVSSGCFPASAGRLVVVDGDVRPEPVGVPNPEPDVECYRAITSIALLAIDADDLPAGATVQGS